MTDDRKVAWSAQKEVRRKTDANETERISGQKFALQANF
jgi:hypothetical protein